MPTGVSAVSFAVPAVPVDEPTVSMPSTPVRRIVLPTIAACTPPDQMPPSDVPSWRRRFWVAAMDLDVGDDVVEDDAAARGVRPAVRALGEQRAEAAEVGDARADDARVARRIRA